MTTKISTDNIQAATLATIGSGGGGGSGPRISNVQIANVSYSVLDDTALGLSGGYLIINGTGFQNGCTVVVNSNLATSVSFVSSTVLQANVGSQPSGTYVVYVTNPDGSTAIRVPGVTYSSAPTWATDSTLPTTSADIPFSIQLAAPGDSSVTYTLQAGSSLPSGTTLAANGLLSGTVTGLSVDTVYNFTVVATDVENQDNSRAFTISIAVGDVSWANVSASFSPTIATLPFIDDYSANSLDISIVGDVRPYKFNPYNPTGYYGVNFTTYTDYISIPATTALTTFTGDFTFEAWVYPSDTSVTYWGLWDSRQSGATSQAMVFLIDPLASPVTGQGRLRYFNGTSYYGTGIVYYNRWTHVAFVRSGSTMTFYIDGVAGGTATVSGTQTGSATTNPVWIGAKDNTNSVYGTTGFISNFRIVNGTAVYTSDFTPPTSPLTAITNTVLLTCQSNQYLDNSTNNYTLTASSTTKINGFIPYTPNSTYGTYGSTYFDGNGDYLTAPAGTQFQFTGNFTVEFWIYLTSVAGVQDFVGNYVNNASPDWTIILNNSKIQFYPSSAATFVESGTVVPNNWYHVAAVRSGSTCSLYVNGVSVGTPLTFSGTLGDATRPVYIGTRTGTGNYLNGYMTDIRIVKSAVYTGAFTPPTAPLTAIANTSLLTCQGNQPVNNNVMMDMSSNDIGFTRFGNTNQGTVSPYGEGWSYYFDGTGDYINVPTNSEFTPGTQNFTFDCWVMAPQIVASKPIVTSHQGGGMFYLSTDASSRVSFGINNSGGGSGILTITGTTVLRGGVWYHLAGVRYNDVLTLYVNGVAEASASMAGQSVGSYFGNKPFYIGGGSDLGSWYTGYISNFRWVVGSAVYTGNFTPPNTPLQPVANTKILTAHSPYPVDDSFIQSTLTKNGETYASKVNPFGGVTATTRYYSYLFNGTTDNIFTNSTSNLALGSGDWTVEAWVFPKSVSLAQNIIMDWRNSNNLQPVLYLINNQVVWRANLSTQITSSTTLVVNNWYHIAVVKSSGTTTMYINGVSAGSFTDSLTYSNDGLRIGKAWDANYWNGFMTDVRIVKGTAVYTGNFSVPTSRLTAVANTQLLTCQSNRVIDNSTNNYFLTPSTSLKITRFTPYTVQFNIKQAWTANTFGGSMYLDGTGDYLTVTTANTYSTLDWSANANVTIEAWYYPTAAPNANSDIIGRISQSTNAVDWSFYVNSSGFPVLYNANGGAGVTVTGTASSGSGNVRLGQWNHVAATINSGNVVLFVNGNVSCAPTRIGAVTTSSASTYVVGSGNGRFWTGYLSDLRIVKNAIYTTPFHPDYVTPRQPIQNTVLLLSGTKAAVYDSKMLYNYETVANARVTTATANVKFSNTISMTFSGNDYINSVVDRPEFGFSIYDFTVEMWIRPTSTTSSVFFDTRRQAENKLNLKVFNNAQQVIAAVGTSNVLVSGNVLTLGQWGHVALVRRSNVATMYYNGANVGAAVMSTDLGLTGSLTLGTSGNLRGNTLFDYRGQIADVRVTKGSVRYTSNFTPPTVPNLIK